MDIRISVSPPRRVSVTTSVTIVLMRWDEVPPRRLVAAVGTPTFPTLSPLTTFDPTNLVLWEDYPRGLYDMELHVKDRYGLPMNIWF